MERDGHLGISLLLSAPFAYILYAGEPTAILALGVTGVVFWSLLPDVDQLLPIPHRGPTHSFVAAGIAGLVTATLAAALVATGGDGYPAFSPESTFHASLVAAGFGFGIGALGVVSHLLGDVITPMGIRPWWPRSSRKYSLSLVLSADIRANLALAYAGTLVLIGAISLSTL